MYEKVVSIDLTTAFYISRTLHEITPPPLQLKLKHSKPFTLYIHMYVYVFHMGINTPNNVSTSFLSYVLIYLMIILQVIFTIILLNFKHIF